MRLSSLKKTAGKHELQNPNVPKHVEGVDGGVEVKGQDANAELGVEYMTK